MPGEDKLQGQARVIYDLLVQESLTDPGMMVERAARLFANLLGASPEETETIVALVLAIAQWESGMQPGVKSRTTGDESYGLFQLNTAGKGAGWSPEELVDPLLNAVIGASYLVPLAKDRLDAGGSVSDAAYDMVVSAGGQNPRGAPSIRAGVVIGGESEEDVAAVRRMVATIAGAGGAPAAPTTPGGDLPVFNEPGAGGQIPGNLSDTDIRDLESWNNLHPEQPFNMTQAAAAMRMFPNHTMLAALAKFAKGILPGEAEQVTLTDEDIERNVRSGANLSDRQMREAKILDLSFSEYAFLQDMADALDVPVGALLTRYAGGEGEAIQAEALAALAVKVARGSALGATEAERLANYKRAMAAGLTLEEAELAYASDVPFEEAAQVKGQIASLAAGENVAPEDVPSLDEALAGRALGLTPFDVMQAGAQERRRLAMTQGRMTPEEFAAAEHLGQVAVARGEMTEEERAAGGGRGGLFVGGQELARIQQRLGARSAEEYANILMDQGLTASEVRRRVEARWGREEAADLFRVGSEFLGYAGYRGGSAIARLQFGSEAGERLAGQRVAEAYLEPGRVSPGRTPGGAERIEEIQAGIRQQRPGLAERLEERRRAREAGEEEQAVLAFMNPRRRRSQPPAGFR